MNLEYYYNNVPGVGKVRNNLVYTSLINEDKTVFVKWFHNDTKYHMGKNQVVDPELMSAKFERELKFLKVMQDSFPMHVPLILDIDYDARKIYLQVDGSDFWEQAGCDHNNFDKILPDWKEQMLEIVKAHKFLGLYKYSMHPSSYFIVNGKLKSINYFFTYSENEPAITIEEHRSHISLERQEKMESIMKSFNMNWNDKIPFHQLQQLCFESFRYNYPKDFINSALQIYGF